MEPGTRVFRVKGGRGPVVPVCKSCGIFFGKGRVHHQVDIHHVLRQCLGGRPAPYRDQGRICPRERAVAK